MSTLRQVSLSISIIKQGISPFCISHKLTHFLLQKMKSNPIYGISSEGYTGKGAVQSPPAKKAE